MAPLYSMPRPSGFRLDATRNLYLDDRSGELIQAGRYQAAIPTTDAELVAQGWPSILGAVDGDLWLCDEGAGNLVGKVNGYQLAPQNAPLQDRTFNGLPYGGNLWAKKAVEFLATANECFAYADASVLDIHDQDCTFSYLIRTASVWRNPGTGFHMYLDKDDGANGSWAIYDDGSGQPTLLVRGIGGYGSGVGLYDGGLHLVTVAFDRSVGVSFYIDGVATVNVAGADATNWVSGGTFDIGSRVAANFAPNAQIAWAMVNIGVAATRVGHDALWAALNSDWLGTDNTYARANPLTTRISNVMGYVATAGANQFMPGYNANASAGDNPLKTGVVCEDGATFLGLGSDNMPAYVGTNAVVTAADGPSGMRDACRVADTDGVNAGYATSGSANLAGATNVPFIFSAYVKSGGVGLNAVYQSYYTGDGGGPELVTNWTIVAALQPVWRPFIGGPFGPVGAAHTAVVTRLIPTDNVGASLGTVDFAEVWGVQNSAVDRLAWRRVATGAAAATGTAVLSYANAANAVYDPARGRLLLRIAGFAGTNGATFLGFGAAAANGALVLDYNAGALRLRIYNNAGALIGTAACGAVSVANHDYIIEWDAALGKASVIEGATVLGSFAGVWAPAAAGPNPVYVGSDSAGANAARCYVNCLFGYSY